MFTKLMIGIDVILYGLANLAKLNVTLRTFYWGLVVLGIVYLVETFFGPVSAHLPQRTAKPAVAPPAPEV